MICGGHIDLALPCDVHIKSEVEQVCEAIASKWDGIDILVNNVGGGGRWGKPSVVETDEKVWMEVYEKNAMAAVRFTVWALPYMRKKKWGRVVTITSRHGREGGGRPWFNMAKAAETSMMKTLGMDKDLARDGVTFNSVAPGNIMIPGTGWEHQRKQDPEAFNAFVDRECPMGRLGTPEEVASMVAFLCSSHASFVNGASIAVDGAESRTF